MKKKVLYFENETEKVINSLCDFALRGAGLQAFGLVNQLDALIKEEIPSSKEDIVQD